MNHFTAAVQSVQPFGFRSHEGREFAEALVQIPAYKDGDEPIQIKLVSWKSDSIKKAPPAVGQWLLVEGGVKVSAFEQDGVKQKVASISADTITPIGGQIKLNKIALVGNAGYDAEVKYFESGKVKGGFTMAVRRPVKNSDPDWFDIELWDKPAQVAGDYVLKGSQVGIVGSLRIEHWQDRNTGAPRSKPIINATGLHLLGSKQQQTTAPPQNQGWGSTEQRLQSGVVF